ncbi:hypothetical protein [Prolixibacter bellariivorans]|uniref:hypothetical protein n=1 Tax=Prolixibacter bellariivorans TaxID=314319 RepID=UPI000AB1FA9A|nr:hypothetical protein [Prolixibacter bellariivorans]
MEINWTKELEPLFQQYGKRQHPLDYKNRYQLVVMVVLSAQDSDKHINEVAPGFFAAYPDMEALSRAEPAIYSNTLVRSGILATNRSG